MWFMEKSNFLEVSAELNMIYNTIPLILILLSLGVIIFIVIRKFPMLANIDMESMPAHKEAKVKEQIIGKRLKRSFFKWGSFFAGIIKPIIRLMGDLFKAIHDKLVALKETYKKELIIEDFDSSARVEKLFTLFDELIKEEKFIEAEKKLIEIIALDNKNIKAFKALGGLYFSRKNYQEAIETFEYVLKLKEDDDAYAQLSNVIKSTEISDVNRADSLKIANINIFRAQTYFDLSLVHMAMDRIDEALASLRKALEIEPNNPRYLDTMFEISIIKKDKDLAEESYKRLAEANPENQKLTELKKQIDEI